MKDVYEKLWAGGIYRLSSSAISDTKLFFLYGSKPSPGDLVIDYGCGSGKGIKALFEKSEDLNILGLDFAYNALDSDVKELVENSDRVNFKVHDLTQPIPFKSKYGFCTDVMEHIQPELVETVLSHIYNASDEVLFCISNVPDEFGKKIGQPLHLTVEPFEWWEEKLEQTGFKFRLKRKTKHISIFYCKKVL